MRRQMVTTMYNKTSYRRRREASYSLMKPFFLSFILSTIELWTALKPLSSFRLVAAEQKKMRQESRFAVILLMRQFSRCTPSIQLTERQDSLTALGQPNIFLNREDQQTLRIRCSASLPCVIYLSNRPQVSMGYRLINHAGCW